MLPYLGNRDQKSLSDDQLHADRSGNIKPVGYVVPPCVVTAVNTCVQLFPSQALCASEGGVWWGAADTVPIRRYPSGRARPSPIAAP